MVVPMPETAGPRRALVDAQVRLADQRRDDALRAGPRGIELPERRRPRCARRPRPRARRPCRPRRRTAAARRSRRPRSSPDPAGVAWLLRTAMRTAHPSYRSSVSPTRSSSPGSSLCGRLSGRRSRTCRWSSPDPAPCAVALAARPARGGPMRRVALERHVVLGAPPEGDVAAAELELGAQVQDRALDDERGARPAAAPPPGLRRPEGAGSRCGWATCRAPAGRAHDLPDEGVEQHEEGDLEREEHLLERGVEATIRRTPSRTSPRSSRR